MASETISLEPLEEFDGEKSIDFREARKMIRGRGGMVSLEVLRRWANPERGHKPRGETGPTLVFPAVKLAGEWRTMPSWVEAFERERVRQGRGASRPQPVRPERTPRRATADHRRAQEYLKKEGMGAK
jgi:hypothetical protein